MAKSKIRWWESGRNLGFKGTVVATVVAAGLLAAFERVRTWASVLWHAFIYPVPIPLIVLVALVAALLVLAIRAFLRAVEPAPPPWLNYREDTLLGIVWRWSYDGHYLARSSLSAYCPQCQIGLRGQVDGYREFKTSFICDECRFVQQIEGNREHVLDRVCRLIEREVNLKLRQQ